MEIIATNLFVRVLILEAVTIGLIALWIYALVDVLRYKIDRNERIIWLLTVLLLPILGVFLYFVVGKKRK